MSVAGLADFVTEQEKQKNISQMLIAKFPQVVDLEPMEEIELVYIHVEPIVISLLDYQQGFGHTELFDLS